MKKSTLALIILVVVAVLAMVTWKVFLQKKASDQAEAEEAAAAEEAQKIDETDAGKDLKGTLRGAADNFAGYFFLRSPEFQKLMRRSKYRVVVIDDFAAGDGYRERMQKVASGEYQFAVATIDSNILNSADLNFPGVITMVIDETRGADCVYALKTVGQKLDDFRRKQPRVAFTPDSPTHHVLKNIKSHFGLPEILPAKGSVQRVETNGSEQALARLVAGEAEVAGMWEPQCTQAKADPRFVEIFSTKDTEGYVVDVLLLNRKFLADNQPLVKKFIENYFRTLKFYFDNPDRLVAELKKETGLSEELVKSMMGGIAWQNLTANATRWFGIARPGENADEMIVAVIESTVKVLIENGDFQRNPLPDEGNPYEIFYPDIIEALYLQGLDATSGGPDGVSHAKFDQLSPERWQQLKVEGNFKVPEIEFQGGTFNLTFLGKSQLDELAGDLKHFPMYRLMVIGHTSVGGDEVENEKLSLQRAEAVVQYFVTVHSYDPNRCLAVGKGSSEPLPMAESESLRHWRKRLKRVQIILVKEVY